MVLPSLVRLGEAPQLSASTFRGIGLFTVMVYADLVESVEPANVAIVKRSISVAFKPDRFSINASAGASSGPIQSSHGDRAGSPTNRLIRRDIINCDPGGIISSDGGLVFGDHGEAHSNRSS